MEIITTDGKKWWPSNDGIFAIRCASQDSEVPTVTAPVTMVCTENARVLVIPGTTICVWHIINLFRVYFMVPDIVDVNVIGDYYGIKAVLNCPFSDDDYPPADITFEPTYSTIGYYDQDENWISCEEDYKDLWFDIPDWKLLRKSLGNFSYRKEPSFSRIIQDMWEDRFHSFLACGPKVNHGFVHITKEKHGFWFHIAQWDRDYDLNGPYDPVNNIDGGARNDFAFETDMFFTNVTSYGSVWQYSGWNNSEYAHDHGILACFLNVMDSFFDMRETPNHESFSRFCQLKDPAAYFSLMFHMTGTH